MNNKTLIIIGNGFDLFHEMPTSYYHFRNYLKTVEEGAFLERLEFLINCENLWSEFELNLALLDYDKLDDFNEKFDSEEDEEDYFDEDDDENYYNYKNHFLVRMADNLNEHFCNWIESVKLPVKPKLDKLINADFSYINFNYTKTLEEVYKIPCENVFHIHGAVGHNLLFGHNSKPEKIDLNISPNVFEAYIEEVDFREEQDDFIINEYFKHTYKDVPRIVNSNKTNFLKLKDVSNIWILGHSIGIVDIPYFKRIHEITSKNQITWNVSYYDKNNIERMKNNFKTFGIKNSKLSFFNLDEIK